MISATIGLNIGVAILLVALILSTSIGFIASELLKAPLSKAAVWAGIVARVSGAGISVHFLINAAEAVTGNRLTAFLVVVAVASALYWSLLSYRRRYRPQS